MIGWDESCLNFFVVIEVLNTFDQGIRPVVANDCLKTPHPVLCFHLKTTRMNLSITFMVNAPENVTVC